jgi:hypothetical protein
MKGVRLLSDNNVENKAKSIEDNSSNLFFNQKALTKLQSPDDLDKYLSVSTPGAWLMVAACLLVMVGYLFWCIYGISVDRTTLNCVKNDDYLIAFADAETAIQIEKGDSAYINGKTYTVKEVVLSPVNNKELVEKYALNPLLADVLIEDKKSYVVLIDVGKDDIPKNKPLEVSIILDERSPIDSMFEL